MNIETFFSEGCMKVGMGENLKTIPFPGTLQDFLDWIGLSREEFETYRFDELEQVQKVKDMGLRFMGSKKYLNHQVMFWIVSNRKKKIPGLRDDKNEDFIGGPSDNYNDACRITLILIWEVITRRINDGDL